MLTVERVREALDYDPETGVFTWRKKIARKVVVGKIAGNIVDARGYRKIMIDGGRHYAHRLAFLYMTGDWPSEYVDHADGDPSNNAWANLREATRSQNMHNVGILATNTSGAKGVSWNKREKCWRAYIRCDGKQLQLGSFASFAMAKRVHDLAARDIHGKFARLS